MGKKKRDDANDELVRTQAKRIEELREENRALSSELAALRAREEDVVKTLDFARKKGDEYVAGVRIRYAMECDRLQKFREKLQKYRTKEALIQAYDEAFRELKAWQTELEKNATSDLGAPMKDFLSEKERLGDDAAPSYSAIAAREKERVRADLTHAETISDEDLRELLDQL